MSFLLEQMISFVAQSYCCVAPQPRRDSRSPRRIDVTQVTAMRTMEILASSSMSFLSFNFMKRHARIEFAGRLPPDSSLHPPCIQLDRGQVEGGRVGLSTRFPTGRHDLITVVILGLEHLLRSTMPRNLLDQRGDGISPEIPPVAVHEDDLRSGVLGSNHARNMWGREEVSGQSMS